MLVLTRKVGERIVMPQAGVVVTVLEMHGNRIRLGITAPADVKIYREEVLLTLAGNQPKALAGTDQG